MNKVGLSVGTAVHDLQKLISIKNAGIDAVEVRCGKYYMLKEFDFNSAKANAKASGIDLWSFHLPFSPFGAIDPSSKDRVKRAFTYDIFCDVVNKATSIGIDKLVIHPSAEPISPDEREEKLEIASDFFNELAEFAHTKGAVLALEDLPRTCLGNCSDELARLLSANDKLRVCYDTNHLLAENATDFIERLGSKIITVHVSDYDFVNERHWLPGEGDNDWDAIYSALCRVGYTGPWLYEIGLLPPKTIERRPLEFTDFYNNAMEIMTGKKPTPIGKRLIINK